MNMFLKRDKIDYVLVDWFGVLSTNYYWCVQSQKNRPLKEWCDCIFKDTDILNQWMRGQLSWEFLTSFSKKLRSEQIVEAFLMDIEYYKPDIALLESVNSLFPKAQKILVTDNMHLFEHILEKYPILQSYFHKMYLSHELGLLKNDSPHSLFDHIRKDLNLVDFTNCVLIDDMEINCLNFKKRGGKVIWIS
jgi:FMN phosphatase YigB (HAD superfamily)